MSADYAEHQQRLNNLVAEEHVYPEGKFAGRGIVICAGGERYFTNAWVCVHILRMHGCKLPIQFWHLGPAEMTDEMRELVKPLGVECVDAYEVRKEHPARILNGWELKAFALLHCPFAEVLFLDADNVALRDPEFLFDTPQYQQTGAIFWPDYGRLAQSRSIWEITGIPYRDEPEFESGQMVIDKSRCWKALNVAMYFNEYSDFYYRHVHGDKETFHLAWRKLDQEYSMPSRGIHPLPDTMCQHDFDGNRIFQHRNLRKWRLFGVNPPIHDFQLESECLGFLEDLRKKWSVVTSREHPMARDLKRQIAEQGRFMYIRVGYDSREITLRADGTIDAGQGAAEHAWDVVLIDGTPHVQIHQDGGVLCDLRLGGRGQLHGSWVRHEKMPIVMLPVPRVEEKPTKPMVFRPDTDDETAWRAVADGNEYASVMALEGEPHWFGDVIDLGGHIGEFSWYAAHKLNAGRIFVVEADQANHAVLRQNLAELISAGRVIALNSEVNGAAFAALLRSLPAPALVKLAGASCLQVFSDGADMSKIGAVVGRYPAELGSAEIQALDDFFTDRGYEFSAAQKTPQLTLFSARKV